MKKINTSDLALDIIVYTSLSLMIIVMIYPFIYVMSLSISDTASVLTGKVKLFPVGFDTMAYRTIFSDSVIATAYLNSIIYSFSTAFAIIIICTLTAYPLSIVTYNKRKLLMKYFVFTMYFNGGLIPFYMVVHKLHLVDSMWSIVIPNAINVMYVIIIRSFFDGIPESMRESALIDGASEFKIYWKVILPLSKPVLAAIGLFALVGAWNNFFSPFLFLKTPRKYPLTIILRMILITQEANQQDKIGGMGKAKAATESVRAAAIMVSILPIITIYPLIQKYFTQGMMIGAIKG